MWLIACWKELSLMIGFVIVATVVCVILSERPIKPEKILRVDFLGKKDHYQTGYAEDGFSWGDDGFRTYYSKKTSYVGTYAHFRVTYKNGYVRDIWSRVGTKQCKGLVEFIERQEIRLQEEAKAKEIAEREHTKQREKEIQEAGALRPCPACGKMNRSDSGKCWSCGETFTATAHPIKVIQNSDGSVTCPSCGRVQGGERACCWSCGQKFGEFEQSEEKTKELMASEAKETTGVATILGAGTYTFGKNIPAGTYDLTVVRGDGYLTPYDHKGKDVFFTHIGIGNKNYAEEYRGLSSDDFSKFIVEGSVEFEIRKSQMITIE